MSLVSIVVTPNPVTVAANAQQQFTAVGYDASGNVVSISPTWSVTASGGTIDVSGLFTAGTVAGDFANTIRATASGVFGRASVSITTTALASVQDVKNYLRLRSTAEDSVIAQMLARATGEIEGVVGRFLTHQAGYSWIDDAVDHRLDEAPRNLVLVVPCDEATVTVTDASGDVVDATTYAVRQDRGLIVGNAGVVFPNPPYTMVATVGFDQSPTYATRELPIINDTIILYTAFLYQQRTVGARSVKGAASTVDYEVDPATGLPKILSRGIRKLRGIVMATG